MTAEEESTGAPAGSSELPDEVDDPVAAGDVGAGPGFDDEHHEDVADHPYLFDPAHLAIAAEILDAAYSGTRDDWDRGPAVRALAESHGMGADDPLCRELALLASYTLRLGAGPSAAGCELGPATVAGEFEWPRAIASVDDEVVRLWEELAGIVQTPGAIARISDVLFCRRSGNGRDRALVAADAYLAYELGAPMDLAGLHSLIRAWSLARMVRLVGQDEMARSRMAIHIDALISVSPPGPPGIVFPMLSAIAVGPPAGASSPVDPLDVDGLLERSASIFRRGDLASALAEIRRGRAATPEALERISRDEVEAWMEDAEAAGDAGARLSHLETAARIATTRMLPDLRERAAAALQRMDPSELGMEKLRTSISIPRDIPESWMRGFTDHALWQDAIRYFLRTSPPSGSLENLHKREIESRAISVFRRSFASMALGSDGLPRATTQSLEEERDHEVASIARMMCENQGQLMAEGLQRLASRYGVPQELELAEQLSIRKSSDLRYARVLARAMRHYWAGDWLSAVHLSVPLVEAAARSLLRELDEGVYRVQQGSDPAQFPGLYVLLAALEDLALDESWAYFLRWLYLGPWGQNLRNTVAHGSVQEVGPVYAALCLRGAALLVWVADPLFDPRLTNQPIARDEVETARRGANEIRSLLSFERYPNTLPPRSGKPLVRFFRRLSLRFARLAAMVEEQ